MHTEKEKQIDKQKDRTNSYLSTMKNTNTKFSKGVGSNVFETPSLTQKDYFKQSYSNKESARRNYSIPMHSKAMSPNTSRDNLNDEVKNTDLEDILTGLYNTKTISNKISNSHL